jgi:hypothetical protein
MYHSKPLYSNIVMKTGTYSKNVNEYSSGIKIRATQNVIVQKCNGAVSHHFHDCKRHTFLIGRHGSVMRTFTGK